MPVKQRINIHARPLLFAAMKIFFYDLKPIKNITIVKLEIHLHARAALFEQNITNYEQNVLFTANVPPC